MRLSTRLLLAGAVAPVALLAAAFVFVGALLGRALQAEVDRALLAQAAVESVSLFDRVTATAPTSTSTAPPSASPPPTRPPRGALYGPTGCASSPEAPTPARAHPPPSAAPRR